MCEDQCLKSSNGSSCGVTSHFTNFAILLSGQAKGGRDDPCSTSTPDYILPYLSMGLIALAICIVLVSVFFIEVRIRLIRVRAKNQGVVIEIDM